MRLAIINYDVINEWSEVKQNTTVILVKKKKEVEGVINLCALANNETCEEKLVARGDASCLSPSDTLKQKYIKFPSTVLLI